MIKENKVAQLLFNSRPKKIFIFILIWMGMFLSLQLFISKAEAYSGSNLAQNKTATASCSMTPYLPGGAIDGLSTTPTSRWYCSTGISGGPMWLKVDLGSISSINGYSVTGMGNVAGWGPDLNPSSFKLQSSNDGSTWVNEDTVVGNSSSFFSKDITTPFMARYVRLNVDYGNQKNNYWTSIMEFEIFGYPASSNLSSLKLGAGTLSPVFDPGKTDGYSTSVSSNVYSILVTAVPADSLATVKVNGNTVTGATYLNLLTGPNPISVKVTAPDNLSSKTYSVIVIRQESSDNISSITFGSKSLTSTADGYRLDVGSEIKAVNLGVILSDPHASFVLTSTVTGAAYTYTAGSISIPNLATGTNSFKILLTSQDGSSKSFNLVINRSAQFSLEYIDKNNDGKFDIDDVRNFAAHIFDINQDGFIDIRDVQFILLQIPPQVIK